MISYTITINDDGTKTLQINSGAPLRITSLNAMIERPATEADDRADTGPRWLELKPGPEGSFSFAGTLSFEPLAITESIDDGPWRPLKP